ncbi:hypothetical protein SLS57_004470 [Botryosphaeria dothidea]
MQLSYVLLVTSALISTGYAKNWHFCTCRQGRGVIASSAINDAACKKNRGWGIAGAFWNGKHPLNVSPARRY